MMIVDHWAVGATAEENIKAAIKAVDEAIARQKAATAEASVRQRAAAAWNELSGPPAPVSVPSVPAGYGSQFVGPPVPIPAEAIRRVALQTPDFRPVGLMVGGAAVTTVGFFTRAMLPTLAGFGIIGVGALGLLGGLLWGVSTGFKK